MKSEGVFARQRQAGVDQRAKGNRSASTQNTPELQLIFKRAPAGIVMYKWMDSLHGISWVYSGHNLGAAAMLLSLGALVYFPFQLEILNTCVSDTSGQSSEKTGHLWLKRNDNNNNGRS